MPTTGSTHFAPVQRISERADENRDVRQGIAQIVQPHGANVQVAPSAMDRDRDAAIDRERKHRNPEHQARPDFDGIAKPRHGFVEQEDRDEFKQHRVNECREYTGAMISVRFLRCGRAQRHAHADPGNDQRGNIGEIVNGIADEGDRMAQVAGDELHGNQHERYGYGTA